MWNNYKLLKESKVHEDIMNVETELSKNQNINFESAFRTTTTTFVDAVKNEIQRVFTENNLNFEYDPVIHQFLRKNRKDISSIASFVNNAELSKVRTILRMMKQEKIQSVVEKITEDYERDFEPKGVTKQEFSYLLQATTLKGEQIQAIITKVGEEAVSREQRIMKNSYIRDLTKGDWTSFLFGRLSPELKEKLNNTERLNIIIEDLQMNEGELKQEVLMASEFNPIMYPLRADNYWPPLKEDYLGIVEEKVLETFDINDSRPVIQGIMSVKLGTVCMSEESNRIKALYKNQFNSNDDKFLNYILDIFVKNGNPKETVENFIDIIKQNISGEKKGKDERKKDSLFPEMEFYFDSIKEKEIVQLVRDEFYLTCVASAMEFPITNDFTMNKYNFITDFVIYCDGLEGFREVEENNEKYTLPVIKNRLLLIGEYYGYYSDLKSKPLAHDLINPDGTPFLKPDGKPAVIGDVLTIGDEYRFKTQYKIITNDFCGRAIGCKTISVNKAESRKEQRREIAKGLEMNRIIYNSALDDNNIEKEKSRALIDLIKWYETAPEVARNASKATLSKYFNVETLEKKSGRDYPAAYQNPKSKYLGVIFETMHLIKSKDLSSAINQSKEKYSTNTIQDEKLAKAYLDSILTLRKEAAKENIWRMDSLKALFAEIYTMRVENGALARPINNSEFLEYIASIRDFSRNDASLENIFKKTAFNYLRSIKRGTIR